MGKFLEIGRNDIAIVHRAFFQCRYVVRIPRFQISKRARGRSHTLDAFRNCEAQRS